MTAGGMAVGGGASITAGGLSITDGLTVGAGGLVVSEGGATVTDSGLVVSLGGMTVTEDGLVVTAGGLSVQSGGVSMINGGLTVNGNVQLATNPTVYSDRRLKANVTRIEDALSMVQALHGVKYSWLQLDHLHEDREEDAASIGRTLAEMRELKSNLEGVTFDTARHVGLMAQDVQSVLPEAVHPIHDGAYLGVNYADLVPLLVEAIRELDAGIEELQLKEKEKEEEEEEEELGCAALAKTVEQLKERVLSLETKNAELRRKLTVE